MKKDSISGYSFNFSDFAVIAVIIIGFALFMSYKNLFTNFNKKKYVLIADENLKLDEKFQRNVEMGSILGGQKQNFNDDGRGFGLSVSWEMKLDNVQGNKNWNSKYDKLKPIIKIGNTPTIHVNHKDSTLIITLQYKDNPFYSHNPQIEIPIFTSKTCKYLVVINGRRVSIYIDEKLVKSVYLGNVPYLDIGDDVVVQVGEQNNNFQGSLNNMMLYYHPIDLDTM